MFVGEDFRNFIQTSFNVGSTLFWLHQKRALRQFKQFFDTVEAQPLTDLQRRSVILDERRNLVVAGAGTGKTSVIVAKAGYLIESGQCAPDDILILAFNRDAAKELAERCRDRLHAAVLRFPPIERLFADPVPAANLRPPRTGLLLAQNADDLLLGKRALLHRPSPSDGLSYQLREPRGSRSPHLRRYALRLCRNPSAADDLVQESIARALTKSRLFTSGTNLRAWVFTIMHNIYVSSLRRGKLIEFPVDPGALTLELAVQPTQGLTLEVNALIKAMKDIPETQRDVVPMFGYEGTTCENIAAPLNNPIGTIKSRVSRGWSALQLAMHG